MRILVTGTSGQVGWEFKRELSMFGELHCPTRGELDLSSASQTHDAIVDLRADLVVNCAAYTAVDLAENEPNTADLINNQSPSSMARACKRTGATLIHLSTDYIFGDMGDQPMTEDHIATPIGVYGQSKLEGERAIQTSGCDHLIFRTSWVYASRGKNFLLTMLRLGAQGKPLRIVDDQWGAPTPARLIASAATHCAARAGLLGGPKASEPIHGTFNLCAGGYTTWHGFAAEIFRKRKSMTGRTAPPLEAISTAQFPTPAKRQANSRLQLSRLETVFGITMPSWQTALEPVIAEALNESPDSVSS